MIAASLNDKANQAFQYIFSEMPKPASPRNIFAPQVKWRPSDTELSAFEQKVSVVLNPLTVLNELENGTITKNHIDALKKVYPKMHQVLKDRIFKEAAKGNKPLDYSGRVKLSLLMDEPLDRTLTGKSILDYQKTFIPTDEGIDQETAMRMKAAQDSASDVQKLMS